jgi:hypothetical protein
VRVGGRFTELHRAGGRLAAEFAMGRVEESLHLGCGDTHRQAGSSRLVHCQSDVHRNLHESDLGRRPADTCDHL